VAVDALAAYAYYGLPAALAKATADVARALREGGEAVARAADMAAAGLAMIVDDIRDFGRVERPHHWIWGLILLVAGVLLLVFLMLLPGWLEGAEA